MADILDPVRRSALMSRIRGKNTRAELRVRQLLFSMGYRYRTHAPGLPGRPDIVFSKRKAVIFVHGCFWHLHTCPAGRIPRTRPDFWKRKLERNQARDIEQKHALEQMGWKVLVVWECGLKETGRLQEELIRFLGPPRWAPCASKA